VRSLNREEKMNAEHGSELRTFDEAYALLADAAGDKSPVSGLTHNFYRYPARFSPSFARAAIQAFSKPGDLVLDPYMGGGTTVVEALAAGRDVVGNDLNSLAAFIARVKVTPLRPADVADVLNWLEEEAPFLGLGERIADLEPFVDTAKTRNLSLSRARFIKKALASALASIDGLANSRSKAFIRCILLRAGQWALDGRESHTTVAAFRKKITDFAMTMLDSIDCFATAIKGNVAHAHLLHGNAADLESSAIFRQRKAALVVTSPPYPGVHVLYHRWQVDGRRETPAPYWIAGCNDGQGSSFYNFADRREEAADKYFEASLATLQAIRKVMCDGGRMIQMIAFNRPADQLPRYLENMEAAGFAEESLGSPDRIWRQVPSRKWHATLKGATHSANEVVLVHRAK
jgi:hypothetical protein